MRFILHSQQTGTFLHKTITLKKVPFKAISQLQYCRSLSTTRTDDFSPNVDHTPVLLSEVLERLKPKSDQWYCDATFGAGGYTRGILDAASCKVVAIDRDIEGIERANQLATQPAYTGRLLPIMGQFGHLRSLVEASTQLKEPCFDGIVFDIGVSSMQIDNAERGFSYRWDGPLDMRMDTLQPSDTAADLINSLDIAELERLFFTYGGEHHSRRIARAIGVARTQSPILRTSQLTELVLKTVRGRTADPYRSVARIFQSLRIQINDEIGELKRGLLAAERLLQPGGRLIVVNFHSLEDQ
ncbi:ribosomal RNA small subunit methyltransferase H [Syncephalis fuscata]|nr:ribosomal RNA small subunit methyltransferase H [Syncephalis fuscata]